MNITVGIDIASVARFKNLIKKQPFLKKIFTERELAQCRSKPNLAQSLAVRFAAKEAVLKTIDREAEYNTIEIVNNDKGKPQVFFHDRTLSQRYESKLSLSHTKSNAVAVCLTFIKSQKNHGGKRDSSQN